MSYTRIWLFFFFNVISRGVIQKLQWAYAQSTQSNTHLFYCMRSTHIFFDTLIVVDCRQTRLLQIMCFFFVHVEVVPMNCWYLSINSAIHLPLVVHLIYIIFLKCRCFGRCRKSVQINILRISTSQIYKRGKQLKNCQYHSRVGT